eukprot:9800889-Alexandrium_andersonii.AAC.1
MGHPRHSITASIQAGASLSKALLWSMSRTARPVGWGPGPSRVQASAAGPVSYTHLTLPTICSV